VPGATSAIDWSRSHEWSFEPLDEAVFPAIRLARQVGVAGSTFPAVYNAANEVAVEAFNTGRISFLDIVDTIERVVDLHEGTTGLDLDSLLAADVWAREAAKSFLSID
jgi:1-deoxy-D-xylulose-5-phosphate reductoisomerase